MLFTTLIEHFGTYLLEKQALANFTAMCQNRHSVFEYATDFETYVRQLSSYDEPTLRRIWEKKFPPPILKLCCL